MNANVGQLANSFRTPRPRRSESNGFQFISVSKPALLAGCLPGCLPDHPLEFIVLSGGAFVGLESVVPVARQLLFALAQLHLAVTEDVVAIDVDPLLLLLVLLEVPLSGVVRVSHRFTRKREKI